jgi:photosystem II stability/assembly factor-like uncharacterized protein
MKARSTRWGLLAVLAVIVVAAGAALFYASRTFSQGNTTAAALAKDTHFHGIAVDIADSSRIYLATHHGLYVMGVDGKAEKMPEVRDYMGFTTHPTDAGILYASGHPPRGGNLGFIASKDGGRSWSKLSDGIDGPVDFHQLAVSKADPRVIYGVHDALQRSADGGLNWTRIGPAPADIIGLAASSIDPEMLYAATQRGLQRSTDRGRSWKAESDGTATMVHVTGDGTVYAFIIGTGLVRTAEKNPAWKVVGKGFGESYLLHFATDPRDPQRFYAVAVNGRTRAQSVITSRDGGERWTPVGAE